MGEVYLNQKPIADDFEYSYAENSEGAVVRVPKGNIVSEENIKKGLGYTPAKQDDVTKLSNEIDDYQAYVISVFEQLKQLIQNGEMDAAVAVLDKAILDLSTLA